MKSDTINIITVTDSTLKSKTFVEKTITIEKSNFNGVNYVSKGFDLLGTISWPLAIIIIVLLLKKQIIELLKIIRLKIQESKSFTISNKGISVATGSTEEIPIEKNSTSTMGEIFSESLLNDFSIKRILSTFWIHQNEHFPDFNMRWTFTLVENSVDYSSFIQTIQKLQRIGITTIDNRTGQFFLTDLGIKYCVMYKDKLGDFSYFK